MTQTRLSELSPNLGSLSRQNREARGFRLHVLVLCDSENMFILISGQSEMLKSRARSSTAAEAHIQELREIEEKTRAKTHEFTI